MSRQPQRELVVLEAAERVGGTALTDLIDGYTVDAGPNGFLTHVPEAWNLATELGLEMYSASELARRRFIYANAKLNPAPLSPAAFFASPLLSWSQKLRVAMEPFAAPPPPHTDESVYSFAQRRLGTGFADVFILSMVQGVSAGDARAISLRSLFPRMWSMEREHGGLLRALLQKRYKQWRAGELGAASERSGPAGPGGRLSTVAKGGIGALVEALHQRLGERVRLGSPVEALESGGDGRWLLRVGGQTLEAEQVVLATPAHAAAELLRASCPEAAQLAASVPYAGVAVVALGFDAKALGRPLDGFGFLVGPYEGLDIMGCLWTSSCFPQQAPPGKVLLRVLLGGSFAPRMVALDDERMLRVVLDALGLSMGISAAPEMVKIHRWPRGIPQYAPGHPRLLRELGTWLAQKPGLHVCNNAFGGIGVNDCVRHGRALGRALAR